MSCPPPPPHRHTRTHTPLPWALSLQDRVCNVTPLHRQKTEAQEAGEPCSEGWRWGSVCSRPGSHGQLTGEDPGHPGGRSEWESESSAPSPSRMESERLQCLLPAPQLTLWPRQNCLVSPGLKPGLEESGHCSGDRGGPTPPTRPALLSHHSEVSGCRSPGPVCPAAWEGWAPRRSWHPQSGWALTAQHQPATGTQPPRPRVEGGWGIGKSDMVCFRSKRPWDWRGSPRQGSWGAGSPPLVAPPRRSRGPALRSQHCGHPLALLQGHLQVDWGVWRLGPSSGEAGPGWSCGQSLAVASCLVDGPRPHVGWRRVQIFGWCPSAHLCSAGHLEGP